MAEPPAGTIALLFSDIEGSTRLVREAGAGWADLLAAHHALLRDAIERHGGYVDGTEGDAFFATFADSRAAVDAAVDAQRALAAADWPGRVRTGVHTGFVERREVGYVSIEVHRAARVGAAAAGGQVLVTAATRALLCEDTEVEDLGEHRLKDFPQPERLFNVVYDGHRAEAFGPPRTGAARPTSRPVGRDVAWRHRAARRRPARRRAALRRLARGGPRHRRLDPRGRAGAARPVAGARRRLAYES